MEFRTPLEVVQAFLDAYNARDISAFLSQLADDVIAEDDDSPTLNGIDAMRNLYTPLFARDAGQKSILAGRITMGLYVIDKEYVSGRRSTPFNTVAIYRVEHGKIVHMKLLREEITSDPFAQQQQ